MSDKNERPRPTTQFQLRVLKWMKEQEEMKRKVSGNVNGTISTKK